MSSPTFLHFGTMSDKYVTLANDSCIAPWRLLIEEEDTKACTSILHMVAVRVCNESIMALFVLKTLNRVSRQDSNWRTSVNLVFLLTFADHACKVYILSSLHPFLPGFHAIPDVEQIVWIVGS